MGGLGGHAPPHSHHAPPPQLPPPIALPPPPFDVWLCTLHCDAVLLPPPPPPMKVCTRPFAPAPPQNKDSVTPLPLPRVRSSVSSRSCEWQSSSRRCRRTVCLMPVLLGCSRPTDNIIDSTPRDKRYLALNGLRLLYVNSSLLLATSNIKTIKNTLDTSTQTVVSQVRTYSYF